ncbi:MAG: hypothetical protein COB67_04130 [SAR324 cluster bacterium]|uniref:HipA-like C-terminal domain-containing protein n=1 Tax=SAR324 cluster bacterium TaxID=2024889 RepID=A0A2A4T7Y2_9DELT|nr:MAG: hypothetical protein COB67_04130 [SAR324 cluster bacterium]
MVLFDSLIGNTDRHQENWGLIFRIDGTCCLTPLFDNGTSLGHERFPEHVKSWNKQRVTTYVRRGCHHLRYIRDEPKNRIKHFDFVKYIAKQQVLKNHMNAKMDSINPELLLDEISGLRDIDCDIRFTSERFEWISRLLNIRVELIKEELK